MVLFTILQFQIEGKDDDDVEGGCGVVVFEQCQGANGTWVLWWRRAMAQNWYRGVIPFTSSRRLLMLFTFPHYSQPHCNHHHHCLDDQELLNLLTQEGCWVMRGIRQKQPPLSAREPHNCTLCTSWTFLHYYPQIVCCTCPICVLHHFKQHTKYPTITYIIQWIILTI